MRVNSCANTLQLNKLPHLGDNVCLPILEGAIRIGEILLSQLVLFTLYFDICHKGGHGFLEGFLGRKRNRDGIKAHGMIV